MLIPIKYIALNLYLITCLYVRSTKAFDDDDVREFDTTTAPLKDHSSLPKDKILLREVKILTFLRNKRTTSRRTHSIHQLTCVGGTAGCKLFTPNAVECEKLDYDDTKGKYNWKCRADISDRVTFNHVDVICEGYDYAEDDYILMGSCGLEFTLDYADPHDVHHHSYFHHMDNHEKEMHHEKVRASAKTSIDSIGKSGFTRHLVQNFIANHLYLFISFIMLALFSYIMIKLFNGAKGSRTSQRVSSYGPLASAMLTTKKAC